MANRHPAVSQVIALLEALKRVIQDFAAREEKLVGEFRAQTAAAAKWAEDAAVQRATRLAEGAADEARAFEERKRREQNRYERLKARLHQAHTAVRRRILDDIAEQHGRAKYKIQTGTLEAERRRDEALAAAAAALENFRTAAAENIAALEALEKSARKIFACRKFRRLLSPQRTWPEPDLTANAETLFARQTKLQEEIRADLERFQQLIVPRLWRFIPAWLAAGVFLISAAVAVLNHFRVNPIVPTAGAEAAGAAALVWLGFYFFGTGNALPLAETIAGKLAGARRLLDAALEKAERECREEQERIQTEFRATVENLSQAWREAVKAAMDQRDVRPANVDAKAARLMQRLEQRHRSALEQLEREHEDTLRRLREEIELEEKIFARTHAARAAALETNYQSRWQTLQAEWQNALTPIDTTLRAAVAAAQNDFPDWQAEVWKNWTPPTAFLNAAKFGRLEVNVAAWATAAPKDRRLAPPETTWSVPLSLSLPLEGSILFETEGGGETEAVAAINNIIFRLLSVTPPGKIRFTIFDPVGLGQNFAALMHLADYEEGCINGRIWTQPAQFEEKLAELNEHMEKVIQMYLRNEYATIADYNAQAGSIAEKYHFLVIASFPVNFSDVAARRLRNIAANGARCGVYTLIHWDRRQTPPNDFVPDELRKNSIRLVYGDPGFRLATWQPPGTRLLLDPPPSPEFATRFLRNLGAGSKGSTRVEVPFEQVAPPDDQIWSLKTADELRVPIGRAGATKLQYLEIGTGTRQHALIAGKTGSGKSTLFHIIITNLALWCSPEEVEFYLVDFKKGVEFKCYAARRLPHARVVAIESDRAFGLSVLQRVDAELRRRGDLFRQFGVQDLAGYKKAGGAGPLPRCLLIIDEFQEFFTEEDRVAQDAAMLLDRLVRQGRAFGIHVLLGSQTLGGAYTLARATLGQMTIRIALQCNEADAFLIMDQDNPAPRLLSRPGEGIYNDAAGAIEGNSPFQAVWLPEQTRDRYLAKIRARADEKKFPGPFIFEGNAPADIRENLVLAELLEGTGFQSAPTDKAPVPQPKVWLGAPNAIKGPTEAVFRRQSGSHLLIVGQSEERELTLLTVALLSLAAQFPKETARFVVLDNTPPGFPERDFLERVLRAVPHAVATAGNANLAEVMTALAEELKKRAADEAGIASEIFLLIHGLQNFKKLRTEDEFSFTSGEASAPNPAAILQSLISDGPAQGIHIIATCDTYHNVNRFLGRKGLAEFEMRVLFQMSAGDSASLVESPDASTLGLHRALYYNDREGYTEIFRPYARPDREWLEAVTRSLAGR